ncbi:MAG: polymer-forming cytoskeletal protein [Candidatus Margulisiibacteriota bacterium]
MKIIKPDYVVNETIQTIVGLDSHLVGVINAENSLRLEGSFTGEINSQGMVFVGYKSIVKATIRALRLVIAGEVIGNVEVIDSIDILSTGKLTGDINGKKLTIDEGAFFKGKVNMDLIAPAKIENDGP